MLSAKPVGRILLSTMMVLIPSAFSRIARQLSDNVWIAAPMDNKSGASRVTLRRDIIVETRSRQFAIGGTPSDCVILALEQLMETNPILFFPESMPE